MSEKPMNKIKINKQVEEEISVVSMLTLLKGRTAYEFLDEFVELYKESDGINVFTAEDTDSIMQVLESMPGYSAEKLLIAYTFTNITIDNMAKVFEGVLLSLYLTLSITNLEIFEKYEEENNG